MTSSRFVKNFVTSIWLTFALLLLGINSTDAKVVVTPHVRAQLLSEVDAIKPETPFWVALHLDIAEGWHTYWKNAGDSGNAPTLAWDLPQGFRAGPINWPYPQRLPVGPLMNYGYTGEAWMLLQIFPPDKIADKQILTLTADAQWLVCKEHCIPESGRLILEIPVRYGSVSFSQHAPAFERQRQRLPQSLPWPVTLQWYGNQMDLLIEAPEFAAAQITDLWFYPAEYGWVEHAAEQPLLISNRGMSLSLTPGEIAINDKQPLSGVLVIAEQLSDETITRAFTVQVTPQTGSSSTATPTTSVARDISWRSALMLAFMGGVLLNVMPCVFPVLSIKAMSIVQQARQAPQQVRRNGLAFTAGVLVTFLTVAGLAIALRASGVAVGWGFQLQSPMFVVVLAWLIFAMGLLFSGAWSLGGAWFGIGDSLTAKSGSRGAFFTGVLAVVVATPCTAPFMGAAVGFALSQPALLAFTVFAALGMGMALPWLLLSYWPAVQRVLPAPGPWMERVKQLLAFPMYATAAWLVWVAAQQIGAGAVAVALSGALLIAFGAWLWHNSRLSARHWRLLSGTVALGCLFTLVLLLTTVQPVNETANQLKTKTAHWEPFTLQRLSQLRTQSQPVLINFTAAWCITCLVNEKVALSTERVKSALADKQVVYLKGDWTRQDPQITAMLEQFGRSGVPLYILYPRRGEPEVLPAVLSESLLLSKLERI